MSSFRLFAILAIAAAQPVLTGCGPTQAQIDPRNVSDLKIRPSTGQMLYCPGDAFGVEFVAKLKDGSVCSNFDANSGCMNQKDTVIDPQVLRLSGNAGQIRGQSWATDADPLKTADTGIRLRGWLEANIKGNTVKSMESEIDLKPVYQCQQGDDYTPGGSNRADGSNGGAGPNVTIAITTLSTPFYPDAALVRVEWNANRRYFISSSADKPIRIIVGGQSGARGTQGTPGVDGKPGADAKEECKDGGIGTDGTAGGPGGKGGDGGKGGIIKVILDETNADKLKGRLLLAAPGGGAGAGGAGGSGGKSGPGGAAGPVPKPVAKLAPAAAAATGQKDEKPVCEPKPGAPGKAGDIGALGPKGVGGADGAAPVFEMGKRGVVWANELQIIQRIEGAGGRAK